MQQDEEPQRGQSDNPAVCQMEGIVWFEGLDVPGVNGWRHPTPAEARHARTLITAYAEKAYELGCSSASREVSVPDPATVLGDACWQRTDGPHTDVYRLVDGRLCWWCGRTRDAAGRWAPSSAYTAEELAAFAQENRAKRVDDPSVLEDLRNGVREWHGAKADPYAELRGKRWRHMDTGIIYRLLVNHGEPEERGQRWTPIDPQWSLPLYGTARWMLQQHAAGKLTPVADPEREAKSSEILTSSPAPSQPAPPAAETKPMNDRPYPVPGLYDPKHPERGGAYTVGGAEGRKKPWPPEAIAEIERLKKEVAECDRAFAEADAARDRLEDALAETHRELGGDGEWCAHLPSQPPPNSGDLARDVPVLAALVAKRVAPPVSGENQGYAGTGGPSETTKHALDALASGDAGLAAKPTPPANKPHGDEAVRGGEGDASGQANLDNSPPDAGEPMVRPLKPAQPPRGDTGNGPESPNSSPDPDCGGCRRCLEGKTNESGLPVAATRMILCPVCGNKRCPKASDCRLDCTDSNEPGQSGSVFQEPAPPEAVDRPEGCPADATHGWVEKDGDVGEVYRQNLKSRFGYDYTSADDGWAWRSGEGPSWEGRMTESVRPLKPAPPDAGEGVTVDRDLNLVRLGGICVTLEAAEAIAAALRDQPTPPAVNLDGVRPSVAWFARRMEATLRRHDAKKGGQPNWRKDQLVGLIGHLKEEVRELNDELLSDSYEDRRMVDEAVDVANMAMMVADTVARAPEADDSQPGVPDMGRYEAKESVMEDGGWTVRDADDEIYALYYPRHPAPEAAANTEADRLNGQTLNPAQPLRGDGLAVRVEVGEHRPGVVYTERIRRPNERPRRP